jgi:2-polyprenyl-3-methyl-5-hydroxy-6-metoxy-1,4-benzoquinol methylase
VSEGVSVESRSIVYNGKIDLLVRNNSHTTAVDLIEQFAAGRSLRVLDAGCASGYLGQTLKARGHVVWGVEPDPDSAAQARNLLDRVEQDTIENFFLRAPREEDLFDVVVFGDVLEHTSDPLKVLRLCRNYLHPSSAIIASVPNVAHLAVRAMLLEGRWDYDERGILDQTHLRFFTRTSLAKLFSAAFMDVDVIVPVTLSVSECGIDAKPDLVTQVRNIVRDDGLDVFQYVLLAKPSADCNVPNRNERFISAPSVRVLCLPPLRDWSVGNIRLRYPLSAWSQRHGGSVRFGYAGELNDADFEWANVIVFQRESDVSVLQLIDRCHAVGKYVVFDIDDLLTNVPEFLIAHEHSLRVRPYLEAAMGVADLVTTTTAHLAQQLSTFNDSVSVIPNCPLPVLSPARHYTSPDAKTLLFVASSDTVRVDFLVPALRQLVSDPSLNLNLVGIGPPGKFLADAGLPVAALDTIDYENFGHFLAAHDNAIGLIPLDSSEFSSCKSPIKFLDYSQAGFACICSRVKPYVDVVKEGETGLLVANDAAEWYSAIARLALSPSLRSRLAEGARRQCQEFFSLRVAGDGWERALRKMLTEPVNQSPAWDEASTIASEVRSDTTMLNEFFQLAAQPKSYFRAIAVFREEGFFSLIERIIRRLRQRTTSTRSTVDSIKLRPSSLNDDA